MHKNMGTIDRSLRILAAAAIAVLYLAGTTTGMAAILAGVVAAIFVVSSAVGFCPIYVPLGISTRRESSRAVPRVEQRDAVTTTRQRQGGICCPSQGARPCAPTEREDSYGHAASQGSRRG